MTNLQLVPTFEVNANNDGLHGARLHMLELAAQHKALMVARFKAVTTGLAAIHEALVVLCHTNEDEQKALLAQYPELMLLVLEEGKV